MKQGMVSLKGNISDTEIAKALEIAKQVHAFQTTKDADEVL